MRRSQDRGIWRSRGSVARHGLHLRRTVPRNGQEISLPGLLAFQKEIAILDYGDFKIAVTGFARRRFSPARVRGGIIVYGGTGMCRRKSSIRCNARGKARKQ